MADRALAGNYVCDLFIVMSLSSLLPSELWLNVLSRCSPFDVLNFMEIDQTCHSIGRTSVIWENQPHFHRSKKDSHKDHFDRAISDLCNVCFGNPQKKPKYLNDRNLCQFCLRKRRGFENVTSCQGRFDKEIVNLSARLQTLKEIKEKKSQAEWHTVAQFITKHGSYADSLW